MALMGASGVWTRQRGWAARGRCPGPTRGRFVRNSDAVRLHRLVRVQRSGRIAALPPAVDHAAEWLHGAVKPVLLAGPKLRANGAVSRYRSRASPRHRLARRNVRNRLVTIRGIIGSQDCKMTHARAAIRRRWDLSPLLPQRSGSSRIEQAETMTGRARRGPSPSTTRSAVFASYGSRRAAGAI